MKDLKGVDIKIMLNKYFLLTGIHVFYSVTNDIDRL